MKRSRDCDKRTRRNYNEFSLERLGLKVLQIDSSYLNRKLCIKATNLLNKSGMTSKVRIKNKCIFTGRSKSIYTFFRLSRIAFKHHASFGNLEGINKSSW